MNYIGKQIDRYRIVEQLGQGGMAVVYKAYDTRLEREVALKIIRTENIPPVQLERLLQRFRREALAQAKFKHSNIVAVHDFGEFDGSPFLVMEYVKGRTLKSFTGTPMNYIDALKLLIPIADALAYAHEQGIIHRDVKPSNILISDRPMLTDFGIAKILENDEETLTGTGIGVGTPEYMAPEQWKGDPVFQTDIYSLGVVLYELVTGKKPYSADTPLAIGIKQATEPLQRPIDLVDGLPEEIEQVLFKALALRPEDRYESMWKFEEALQGIYENKKTSTIHQVSAINKIRKNSTGDNFPTYDSLPTISTKNNNKKLKIIGGIISFAIVGSLVLNILFNNSSINIIKSIDTTTNTPIIPPTPTQTLEIGSILIREKDGMEMIYVPAGEFQMGSEAGELDEGPIHTVFLDAYWIDKYEVTNAQYAKYMNEKSIDDISSYAQIEKINGTWQAEKKYENYPVTYISWSEAQSYCEWVRGSLPTEAQWEKAARGTDGRVYPWGNQSPVSNLLNYDNNNEGLTAIGSFPEGISPYGALDMAGNVWEWVADWYDDEYYLDSPANNPTGPINGKYKILRGGSWASNLNFVRVSDRYGNYPGGTYNSRGFRCILSE